LIICLYQFEDKYNIKGFHKVKIKKIPTPAQLFYEVVQSVTDYKRFVKAKAMLIFSNYTMMV